MDIDKFSGYVDTGRKLTEAITWILVRQEVRKYW